MRDAFRALAASMLLSGCEEPPPRVDPALHVAPQVEIEEQAELPPIPEDELPPAIAEAAPSLDDAMGPPLVAPAAAVDVAYDSDERVDVRRFVYRVALDVPSVLGERGGEVETAAAELYVDVSEERVRARFAGPGWPVAGGSEVRLRGDSPGAYVFDEHGGGPLVPGELGAWFEGGPPRAGPILVVRRDPALRGATEPGPGMLVCALLAEWSGEARENVMRRCATGAPLGFRVGYWRGERMADVTVQAPRREIRADHVDPPELPARAATRVFLEASAQAHLAPRRVSRDLEPSADDGRGPPPQRGLALVNESEARIVVVVDGVAVGSVESLTTGLFPDLSPGAHEIAAMRPLGAVVMRPRELLLPARTILHAPRRPPPEED
ncbi:MAG: hypothetical protein U0234_22455 [Sandaracinus sp.]